MSEKPVNLETPTEIAETEFETALESARALAASSHAETTLDRYESDWGHFLNWCHAARIHSSVISALPTTDESIATYLGSMVETPPGTVKCRIAAIRFVHRRAGHSAILENTPIFDAVYQGYLRRWAGVHRPKQSAATEDRLKLMVDVWQEGEIALRNRAILLLGFDGALRRSEIVGLDVDHYQQNQDGADLYLPKSKGDQMGRGATVTLLRRQSEYCPVESLTAWLNAADIARGPIFRRFHRHGQKYKIGLTRLSDKSIYNLVKESAKKAGLAGTFGAHSLRRGFINSAVRKCTSLTDVQLHVRHKSLETTSRYMQTINSKNHPGTELLENNPDKRSK